MRREQHELMKSERAASKMWTEVKNESRTVLRSGNSSKVRRKKTDAVLSPFWRVKTRVFESETRQSFTHRVTDLLVYRLHWVSYHFIKVLTWTGSCFITLSSVASTQMFWKKCGLLLFPYPACFPYLCSCRCPLWCSTLLDFLQKVSLCYSKLRDLLLI